MRVKLALLKMFCQINFILVFTDIVSLVDKSKHVGRRCLREIRKKQTLAIAIYPPRTGTVTLKSLFRCRLWLWEKIGHLDESRYRF